MCFDFYANESCEKNIIIDSYFQDNTKPSTLQIVETIRFFLQLLLILNNNDILVFSKL